MPVAQAGPFRDAGKVQLKLRRAGDVHRPTEGHRHLDDVGLDQGAAVEGVGLVRAGGGGQRDAGHRGGGLRLRRGRPEEHQAQDEDSGGGAAWTGGPQGTVSRPRPGGRGGAKAIAPARGDAAQDSRITTGV